MKNTPPEFYEIAVEAIGSGDYSKAVKYLEKAIKLDPEASYLYEALGVCFRFIEDYKPAKQALKKAISLDPVSYDSYHQLIEIHLTLEEFDEAEEVLQDCFDILEKEFENDPENTLTIKRLAKTHYYAEEFDEALSLYSVALERDPVDLEAYEEVIDLLHELGELEHSETVCKTALKYFQDNSSLHLSLGLIYQSQNILSLAIKEFKTSLKLGPDQKELQELIDTLTSIHQEYGKTIEETIKFSKARKRYHGFVKWYNNDDGIGCIIDEKGREIVFHYMALRDPSEEFHAEDIIEFSVTNNGKEIIGVNIEKINEDEWETRQFVGKITRIDPLKRFGEIQGNNKRKFIFFSKFVPQRMLKKLSVGAEVAFHSRTITIVNNRLVYTAHRLQIIS